MNDVNRYLDSGQIAAGVRRGEHRRLIGGMWEEIGDLQISFLREAGLEPHHSLLDVGCGSLRGGVRFVDYLDAGNYFGVDANQSLLDAGYEIELKGAGLQHKLPRDNLVCDGDFDFDRFDRAFDFALALSVFTHIPLNHIQVCLERLAPHMTAGAPFFATYFELPAGKPLHESQVHQPGGVTTFATKDPYHYRLADIRCAATNLGWTVERLDGFDHPRAQKMVVFRREA